MEHIERLLGQLDALRASLLNDPTNITLRHQLSSLMQSIQAQQENPEFYQIHRQQQPTPPVVVAPSPPETNSTSCASSTNTGGGGDSGAEYYDASDDLVLPPSLDDKFPYASKSSAASQNFSVDYDKNVGGNEYAQHSYAAPADEQQQQIFTASASADDSPAILVEETPLQLGLNNSENSRSPSATSQIDLISSTTTTTLSCSPPSPSVRQSVPPPPPTPPVLLPKRSATVERVPSPLAFSSVSSTDSVQTTVAPSSSSNINNVRQSITQQQPSATIPLSSTKSTSKASAHEKRRYSQHARTIAGINLVSPFCNLSLLETHPNHMCLFLFSSAASDIDGDSSMPPSGSTTSDLANSLLFYLITAVYRQQTLHTKSESLMQRWAYELYSTFLLPSAPLELKKCLADDLTYRSTLLAHIEDVLAASSSSFFDDSDSPSPSASGAHHHHHQNSSSSTNGSGGGKSGSPSNVEQHTQMLRDVFNEARFRATEHVKLGLIEFNRQQQAATVAGGADFVQEQCRQLAHYTRLSEDYVLDHILSLEHITGGGQRSTTIFERFLAVQLDNLTFKQPLVNVNVAVGDVRKALGSCYSTLAKLMFDRKSLPSLINNSINLIEQWPPMFAKEKSKLMNKIITTMKKPAVSVQGHHFNPESFHVAAFCDLCQQLLWGISPQGYQCQLCQMNVHKLCVITTKDSTALSSTTSGVAPFIDKCHGSNHSAQTLNNNGKKRGAGTVLGELNTKFPRAAERTPPKTAAVLPESGQSSLARTAIMTHYLNSSEQNPFRFDQQSSSNTTGSSFDLSDTTTTTTVLPPQERAKSNSFSVSVSTVTAHHKDVVTVAEPTAAAVGSSIVDNNSFLDLHTSDVELESEPPAWQLRLQQHPAILERLVPRERKRQDVINEFIHTERSQVKNLKVLYQNFYRPMLTQRQMPPHILDLIFANLEEIIELHSALSAALKNKQKLSALIGSISDVLLAKFDGEDGQRLRIAAGTYCQNQSIGLDILRKRQKRDDRLNKFLAEAESNPLCRRLQLRDIIPCEMQRLTRYPLLIEQLIKHTDSTATSANGSFELVDLQRALRCAQDLVAYVNQAAEEASNRHRLTEVQRHMNTAPFDSINLPTTRHFHGLNLNEHRLLYEGDLLWYVPTATADNKQGAYATLPSTASSGSSAEQLSAGKHQYNSKYRAISARALLLNDILVLLILDDPSQHTGSIHTGGTNQAQKGSSKNPRRFVLQYPNAPARVSANQNHSLLLNVDKILSPIVRLDMVRIIAPSAAAKAAMTNASPGFEKRFHFLYKVPSPDGNIKNSKVQFYEFEAPTAASRKSWLERLQQAVETYTNANSQYEDIVSHMPTRARVLVARPSDERKRSRHELLSINEITDASAMPLSRQASGGGSAPPPLNKPSSEAAPVEQQTESSTDSKVLSNEKPFGSLIVGAINESRATGVGNSIGKKTLADPNHLSPLVALLPAPTGDTSSAGSESIQTNATTSGSEDLDDVPAAGNHEAALPSTAANSAQDYDAEDEIAFLDNDEAANTKELIRPELVSITAPPHYERAQHMVVPQANAATRRTSPIESLKTSRDTQQALLQLPSTVAQPLALIQEIDVINKVSTQQLRKAIEQSERLKHLIITTTTPGASVCVVNSPPLIVAINVRQRRRSSSVHPASGAHESRNRASSVPPEHLPLPAANDADLQQQPHASHRLSLIPTSPAPAFDPNLKCVGGDGDQAATSVAPATLQQQLLDITQSLNDQLNTLMTLSTARDAQVRHLRQQCNSIRGSASFPQAYNELSLATLATYERQLPPLQVAFEVETASAEDRVKDVVNIPQSGASSTSACDNNENEANVSFGCYTADVVRQLKSANNDGLKRRLSL